MNQSSVIGAALLVAYVVFVIYRGELPCWFNVLGIATQAQCSTTLTQSQCAGSSTTTATASNPLAGILPSRTGNIIGTIGSTAGGVLGGVLGGGGGLGPF